MIRFALLLTLLTGSAFAGEALVTWENPTTYDDGSPLPPHEIRWTRVEHGTCNPDGTFGDKLGEFNSPGIGTTALFANLEPAQHCFRAFTTTQNGQESGSSNVASKTIEPPLPPKPNPPVIIQVDIQAQATLETATDGSLKLTVR